MNQPRKVVVLFEMELKLSIILVPKPEIWNLEDRRQCCDSDISSLLSSASV